MAPTSAPDDTGIVDPHRLYSFAAFKRITGIGAAGLREARRDGLEVRYFGRKGYILGQTIIDHIISKGRASR